MDSEEVEEEDLEEVEDGDSVLEGTLPPGPMLE